MKGIKIPIVAHRVGILKRAYQSYVRTRPLIIIQYQQIITRLRAQQEVVSLG